MPEITLGVFFYNIFSYALWFLVREHSESQITDAGMHLIAPGLNYSIATWIGKSCQ